MRRQLSTPTKGPSTRGRCRVDPRVETQVETRQRTFVLAAWRSLSCPSLQQRSSKDNQTLFFSDSGGGRHPQELLLLSGDIERNPGPKTNSTTRSDFKSTFFDVMNNDPHSDSSVSVDSTPEYTPPTLDLHKGMDILPDKSCDQDLFPNTSNSKGSEIKDAHIKWADGRTSWVKFGKLKFEGDLDIGLLVKVKWGKHKKLFEGEVMAISYKPEIAENTTDKSQETQIHRNDGEAQTREDDTSDTPTLTPSESQRPRCTTCYGVFRPQYRPLTCSADGCTTLVHKQQICSGFNKDQQQNLNWLCRDHGGNGPSPRDEDQVNDQECASDNCIYCLKKFRTNLSPIICSMCEKGSHASCSGLQRGEIAKLRKSGKWICSPCSGDTSTPNSAQEEDLPKGKCLQCKGAIREGVRRARCMECQQLSHRGCTGLTKSAMDPVLNSNNWMCHRCTTKNQFPQNLPDTDIPAGKHEPKFTGGAKSLRIMQWNADGINTKIAELNHYVKEHKIDVVIIQESKLTENKPTPKLYGYAAVRSDRPGSEFPGGGLLTFIKHNVAYRKVGSAKNGNVEAQSVSIQQSANRWLDITNIYIPPKAKENTITWIPTSEAAILAGDLNGHTPLWDRTQPNDEMGEKLLTIYYKRTSSAAIPVKQLDTTGTLVVGAHLISP